MLAANEGGALRLKTREMVETGDVIVMTEKFCTLTVFGILLLNA